MAPDARPDAPATPGPDVVDVTLDFAELPLAIETWVRMLERFSRGSNRASSAADGANLVTVTDALERGLHDLGLTAPPGTSVLSLRVDILVTEKRVQI